MTRVTLLLDDRGALYGYECQGHAGYAQQGGDIVCAAVSMLATACANALESAAGITPQTEVSPGYMRVALTPGAVPRDASVVLKVFEQGMRDIQSAYPKHIQLTAR